MSFFRRKKAPKVERHPDFPICDGMAYHDVIDAAEAILKPDWYLEIGSRSGTSLARRTCNYVGVDPEFAITNPVFNAAPQMHFMQMTSDDFFASEFLPKLGLRPQMAFVDGLHLFEYALRDIMNCEAVMDPSGVIFVHDVLPFTYKMTEREYIPGTPWTGDVWKAILAVLDVRPDLEVTMIGAAKTGLACIRGLDPKNRGLFDRYDEVIAKYQELDLQSFGADAYFSRFSIQEPTNFVASLAEGKSGNT